MKENSCASSAPQKRLSVYKKPTVLLYKRLIIQNSLISCSLVLDKFGSLFTAFLVVLEENNIVVLSAYRYYFEDLNDRSRSEVANLRLFA